MAGLKKIIGVDQLAQLLVLTPRRVQQLAGEGVTFKAGRGKYDLVRSVQGYVKYLSELIPNKKGGELTREAKADAEVSRAHYLQEKAMLTQMQRKEKQGLLVNKEKERRAAFRLARALRNSMMNIPARVSVRYAAIDESDTIFRDLEKELIEALTMISEMAKQPESDAIGINAIEDVDCPHWFWL